MLKWLSNFIQSRKNKEAEQRRILAEFVEAHRKTVDDYRIRFRTAPYGFWGHAVGTFSNVMDERWEFNADYTGKVIELGPFGGERGETLFEWKEVADFTIACKVTEWPYEADEDAEEMEPEEWELIRYDFRMTPTDSGEIIAMYQVFGDETIQKGFWLSAEPLMYRDRW
ncbi:MAG: hypothetical protein AAGF95_33820 [Chloroflexota bacterium]